MTRQTNLHRDTRVKNARIERIESKFGARLAMLTEALNCVAASEPAKYHTRLAREEWNAAKQEVLATLRAQIALHTDLFLAEDKQIQASLRPAN